MIVEHRQAVVVGSGLAGLTAALSLSPLDTLILTKTDSIIGGSTPWAQGGVAFPRDEADRPLHLQDTIVSGAGSTDPKAAAHLVNLADAARSWLEAVGVHFDRHADGAYQYGREGAHSARRVLHAGADATGARLAQTLAAAVGRAPHITVRPRSLAVRLVPGGLLSLDERGLVFLVTERVVLAGGGLGQLFDSTTAPAEGTGDTIALALEAGAAVRDLEMVQFHPTALALRPSGSPSLSLLTEALRGEGAVLVTEDGKGGPTIPLAIDHPLGSLGPRDVLSRTIHRRLAGGFPVWLDARGVSATAIRFPTVTKLCAAVGLSPETDLLPVVPAVHYTMGGVAVDLAGRTTISGVWAVGEASCTGVHGGNRLASNSLLECVVWGRSAAADALAKEGEPVLPSRLEDRAPGWAAWRLPTVAVASELRGRVQAAMGRSAGPVRDAGGLETGLAGLQVLQDQWDKAASRGRPLGDLTFDEARTILEARNLLALGPALLTGALERTASLGAHFRSDAPQEIP